ncbi:MAG: 50S ribosomal protein L9, partial [Candidatus Aminicenantaceae bacterium]
MKVILKDNIENLGKKGDIVKVAPGYGRNFLLPKKLALKVTATNMKMIEMVQKSLRKGLEKEMKVYMSLIEQLNAVTLTFHRKSGEKDTIFGSVSVTDIRDALTELNFDVEKKKILLDEPIKRLGNYTVPIKVFHDDRAEIKLKVVREGGPGEVVSP